VTTDELSLTITTTATTNNKSTQAKKQEAKLLQAAHAQQNIETCMSSC